MKICPKCHTKFDDSRNFCNKCGTALVAWKEPEKTQESQSSGRGAGAGGGAQMGAGAAVRMKVCPTCGKVYSADRKFCVNDGTALVDAPAAAAQAATTVGQSEKTAARHVTDTISAGGHVQGAVPEQEHAGAAALDRSQTAGIASGTTTAERGREEGLDSATTTDREGKDNVAAGTMTDARDSEDNTAGEMICPKCGRRYPAGAAFCTTDLTALVPAGSGQSSAARDKKKIQRPHFSQKKDETGKGAEKKTAKQNQNPPERQNQNPPVQRPQEQRAPRRSTMGQDAYPVPAPAGPSKGKGLLIAGIVAAVVAVVCVVGGLVYAGVIPLGGRSDAAAQVAAAEDGDSTETIAAQTEENDATGTADETQAITGETAKRTAEEDSGADVTAGEEATQAEEGTTQSAEEAQKEAQEEEQRREEEEQAQRQAQIAALQQDVEETYDNVTAEEIADDGEAYIFDVYREDAWYGRVSVDLETHEITVIEGMKDSPVKDLDVAAIYASAVTTAGKGTISYAVIDLESGDLVGSSNRNEAQSSSVMIDIPILYTTMKQVEQGKISLEDPVTFHYEVGGRGRLTQADDGRSYTLEEMLSYMLQYSDNNATNSLLTYFGYQTINGTCEENGYNSVSIVEKIAKTSDYTDHDNYVSAADLAGMLQAIWESDTAINSAFLSSHMMIQDSTRTDGLGRNIEGRVRDFLNLNGQKDDKYNEIAVVEQENATYGVVFLGNHGTLAKLKDAAAGLGGSVYDGINQ